MHQPVEALPAHRRRSPRRHRQSSTSTKLPVTLRRGATVRPSKRRHVVTIVAAPQARNGPVLVDANLRVHHHRLDDVEMLGQRGPACAADGIAHIHRRHAGMPEEDRVAVVLQPVGQEARSRVPNCSSSGYRWRHPHRLRSTPGSPRCRAGSRPGTAIGRSCSAARASIES